MRQSGCARVDNVYKTTCATVFCLVESMFLSLFQSQYTLRMVGALDHRGTVLVFHGMDFITIAATVWKKKAATSG